MNPRTGICILAGVTLLTAASGPTASRLLRPSDAARMWLPVAGKSRLYYRLEPGKATTLEVKGPGEIKFIVRAVSEGAGTAPIRYSMVVTEGEHVLKTLEAEALPGETKWKGTNETATRAESFKVRVPDGGHALRIVFQSSGARAAGIRCVFREGPPPGQQVALQATGMRESITLTVKERALDYYVADAQVPVQVTVVGPTRVRVMSRLIFPGAARGKLTYTLKVQRDGHSLPDMTFAATKSPVAECESHPDWIIARGADDYLEVPKGEHVILIRLSNADAPGVALRFSIPREDSANGR